MPILFSSPLAEARALLNDVSGAIYGDTPMIPLGNKVYKELQLKVAALGISTSKELTSTPIDVPALTLKLADGALLPADLIYPLRLYERSDGSTDLADFREMTEEEWEQNEKPQETLDVWTWREGEIKFRGATTAREVQIRYVKSLGSITATSSVIAILNSEQWIAQRLAAVAALVIGHNPTRASALNEDLTEIWSDLRATLVKRKQAIPVRRRRTRYRVYGGWLGRRS